MTTLNNGGWKRLGVVIEIGSLIEGMVLGFNTG
jgi:hypothetical protein